MGIVDLQAPAVEFLISAWAELPERWRSGPVQSLFGPNPRTTEITRNHDSAHDGTYRVLVFTGPKALVDAQRAVYGVHPQ
jgi:hypothetical protein